MRATEIIRGVLDLIDQVECAQQPAQQDPIGGAFAQLFAQMSAEPVEVRSAGVYDSPRVFRFSQVKELNTHYESN